MKIMVKLLPATQNDLTRVIELNHQFHLDLADFIWDTSAWIEEEIAQKHVYLVLSDDKTVGAVTLIPHGKRLALETIAIDNTLQGQGLGRKTIESVKEHAKTNNFQRVTLETYASYKLDDFYLKSGFQKDTPYIAYENNEPYLRFVITL
jgi:GNAT superfamily N-acetyltransferase